MTAELQDVLASCWDGYAKAHGVSYAQDKAAHAIMSCRTAALGGHADVCDGCGHVRVSYNSCRNRHCPKCQSVRREQWVGSRVGDLLEAPYFHVVFTVPECLNELFLSNEAECYGALFRASADALLECASDARRLGAVPGFTSVLHTAGQTLAYHPHIHAVVCAGGIGKGGRWKASGHKFFVPVKALSRVFRGKLTEALGRLPLTIRGEEDAKGVADAISASWEREWVVYAKKPFRDAACVIAYLGRYTHRTAISNARIISCEGGTVTFRWRDYRDGNAMKVMALPAEEFVRRFLMHVLPTGFMRIRHYGFMANNGKKGRLARIRSLCGMAPRQAAAPTGFEVACRLAGRDVSKCPVCGSPLRKAPLPVRLC
ncbi:MAG: IS91 family transposase [Eggerthellaceae bacterium]|nr:IS91 family transposase [Eggerthellaceae bacterium]